MIKAKKKRRKNREKKDRETNKILDANTPNNRKKNKK
jgi:hypothetical protein